MLRLNQKQFDFIKASCEQAYPDEGCGVLWGETIDGVKHVRAVEEVPNDSGGDKRRRFELSAATLFSLTKRERTGPHKLLGFYHSHPDHPAVPSSVDKDAAWPVYSYPIISVVHGHTTTWNSWVLKEDGSGYDAEVVEVVAA
ncbi:MAG TPA: M67 family metallopeptidase [Capsulimonadaceae bacterium]|jgi:proteasome lid subunit RPN8/RPN11